MKLFRSYINYVILRASMTEALLDAYYADVLYWCKLTNICCNLTVLLQNINPFRTPVGSGARPGRRGHANQYLPPPLIWLLKLPFVTRPPFPQTRCTQSGTWGRRTCTQAATTRATRPRTPPRWPVTSRTRCSSSYTGRLTTTCTTTTPWCWQSPWWTKESSSNRW